MSKYDESILRAVFGELPSPKGEGFKLRLKPVRVGLVADCPTPP